MAVVRAVFLMRRYTEICKAYTQSRAKKRLKV